MSNRDKYIERVRKAMVTSPKEMSRADYIDALEELAADIDGMLDAAREEQAAEEGKADR